jgi:hypothetical protein
MSAVFQQTLTTAPNNWHILAASLRELRDWPISCWREHQRSLGVVTPKPVIWVNDHKRIWRKAVFILLLISFIGPWIFDRINVPAEYACSPSIRLEGDFCGTPLSGLWIFPMIIGNFFGIIARLVTDPLSFSNTPRQLIVSILYLFLILPFFTTLLLILGKSRRWHSHILGLGLALVAALIFWNLTHFSTPHHLRLWGFWLYLGVITIALLMELVIFRTDKNAISEIVHSKRSQIS